MYLQWLHAPQCILQTVRGKSKPVRFCLVCCRIFSVKSQELFKLFEVLKKRIDFLTLFSVRSQMCFSYLLYIYKKGETYCINGTQKIHGEKSSKS